MMASKPGVEIAMHDDNPYAPPKFTDPDRAHLDVGDVAWTDGRKLIARRGAELPDRCIKCNAPAEDFRFKRTVTWIRPIWLVLIISPLIFALAYFLIRWTAVLTAGLCPRHRTFRRRAILLGWLTVLAGIGIFFIAPAVSRDVQPVVIIGGIVVLMAGAIGGSFGSRVFVPTKIDRNFVWLSNVSPAFMAEFPKWNM